MFESRKSSAVMANKVAPKRTESDQASKRKRIRADIGEILVESAERSSVHGCPSLAASRVAWPLKLVWLGFVAASWAYFIYQMSNSITAYYSYGVSTTSSFVEETPAEFPAVDVCNLNPLNLLAVLKLNQTVARILQSLNVSIQSANSLIEYVDRSVAIADILTYYKFVLVGAGRYENGFTLTNMLVSCQYNGQKCSAQDFFWYYDTYYGNCYRFNGGSKYTNNQNNSDYSYSAGPIKKAFRAGWRSGLRLELYTPTDLPYSYKSGFRVIVHNQSTPVFPDEDGIDVPVGFQTNLAVSRTSISRLPDPYSECISGLTAEIAGKNRALQKIYDQIQAGLISQYQSTYCFKLCFTQFVIDRCSCSPLDYAYLQTGYVICQNSSQVSCSQVSYSIFYAGDSVNTCYSYCPQECYAINYEVEATMADYPTGWYASALKAYTDAYSSFKFNDTTSEEMKETLAIVNVFYSSMGYTLSQETPSFTFDTLIANVGGNLGLFTGMSVLSFVELIELALTVSLAFIERRTSVS